MMPPFIQLLDPAAPDRALIFPGQGSQVVGMGKDLYEQFPSARELFDGADQILGFGLSKLCFQGPEAELVQTRNAQPAIAVTSLALLKVAAEVSPAIRARPAYMAGHSLGEYAALIASGALSFEAGIRLLRTRGELMQAAGDQAAGTMAAIIGLDIAACHEVCRATGAEIATDNAPGQVVIGGSVEAVSAAMEDARTRGATGTIALSVSGAFHTALMQPAAEGLSRNIGEVPLLDPAVPIVANCTAMPIIDAAAIRTELIDQVTSTVQWTRTMQFLASQGVETFVEFGPGHVLTSIIKRMIRASIRINVSDAEGLELQL